METIDHILGELEEGYVAQQVGLPHDEARLSYTLARNTVSDFREYERVIGDYYRYHFSRCVSPGGQLSQTEAVGRAKEALEAVYRRQGGNLMVSYQDAHDGTNGGLRAILDLLADQLKEEAVERHFRQVFDRYVDPSSWEEKVAIVGQFLQRWATYLSPSVRVDQPERYAREWQELVQAYVDALRRTSTVLRRL